MLCSPSCVPYVLRCPLLRGRVRWWLPWWDERAPWCCGSCGSCGPSGPWLLGRKKNRVRGRREKLLDVAPPADGVAVLRSSHRVLSERAVPDIKLKLTHRHGDWAAAPNRSDKLPVLAPEPPTEPDARSLTLVHRLPVTTPDKLNREP